MSDEGNPKLVVGIGEILWDCLPTGRNLGGAPFNFCRYATLCGLDAVPVSAVGADADGDAIREVLARENISHRWISTVPELPTGLVNVTLGEDYVPSYVIEAPAAWDEIPFGEAEESLAERASVICFGSLAQRAASSRKAIHSFLKCASPECIRIFDINLRKPFCDEDVIRDSMKFCDMLKISAEELPLAAEILDAPAGEEEFALEIIRRHSLDCVIVTRGAEGACCYHPGGKDTTAAVNYGPVKDTVGCGDSFTAAFAAARLEGKSYAESLAAAADLAGQVAAGQHRLSR